MVLQWYYNGLRVSRVEASGSYVNVVSMLYQCSIVLALPDELEVLTVPAHLFRGKRVE
jgi:hypothetical protein